MGKEISLSVFTGGWRSIKAVTTGRWKIEKDNDRATLWIECTFTKYVFVGNWFSNRYEDKEVTEWVHEDKVYLHVKETFINECGSCNDL